jgi:hypothetical protein
MNERSRRKELIDNYRQTQPEAGIYRFVNEQTGRMLLGSSMNLPSMQNKLAFAKSTGSAGTLDYRMRQDITAHGIDSFRLEILEVLDITPDMTPTRIKSDLEAMESAWREQFANVEHY